jgi:hypothetical protein
VKEGMNMYDSTKFDDVLALAMRIEKLPFVQFISIAPAIMAANLMNGGFVTTTLVNFTAFVRRLPKSFVYEQIFKKVPALAVDLQKNMVKHMIHGKDAYDKNSAGGYCQQEIDTIVELLESVNG